MGCAVVLIAVVGVIVGLVMLPTVFDISNLFSAPEGWSALGAVVYILPFAFLVLILIGALKVIGRI